MSDDLNEFLKQAAQRRQARQRAAAKRSLPTAADESQAVTRETAGIEVLQPLPTEGTKPPLGLAESLGAGMVRADAERRAHEEEAFGRKPQTRGRSQAPANAKGRQKFKNRSPDKPPATSRPLAPTDDASESESSPHPATIPLEPAALLAMLRDPQSLRLAFIASEIFRRKLD